MEETDTYKGDMGLDELKNALDLSPQKPHLPCWAGVVPGVSCASNIFHRLPRVLGILVEICEDIPTYNAVKQSDGVPELLHRLAVELLCDEPHLRKGQGKLIFDISTALRERLDRWEAARFGVRMSTAFSHPKRCLKLEQKGTSTGSVHDLITVMRRSNVGVEPGYVYCFSDKGTRGYLKIGFASAADIKGEEPSPGYEDRYRLWKRLSEQVNKCKFDMKLEFDEHMPWGGRKIEALIHATLYAQQRKVVRCKTPKCETQHREWFEATAKQVKSCVSMWKHFSSLRPWASSGVLLPKWDDLAVAHLREYGKMSVRDWVEKHWKWVIRDAEIGNNPEVLRLGSRFKAITRLLRKQERKINRLEMERFKENQNEEAEQNLMASKRVRNILEQRREVVRATIRARKASLAGSVEG